MKKTIISLTLSVVVLAGCQKEEIKKDITPNVSVEDSFIEKRNSPIENEISVVNYEDGTYMTVEKISSTKSNLKLYSPSGNTLEEMQSIITPVEASNKHKVILSFVKAKSIIFIATVDLEDGDDLAGLAYPGDCDLLGPRQDGESYSECYDRNFSNFCCDFTGCAALAVSPVSVLAGIALGCAFSENSVNSAGGFENGGNPDGKKIKSIMLQNDSGFNCIYGC